VVIWARTGAEQAGLAADLEHAARAEADPRALSSASMVAYAVPSASLAWNLERTLAHLSPEATVLSAIKGMEPSTGRRMSEVMADVGIAAGRIAVLSGPNLSQEIELGMPAAAVVAAADGDRACAVQALFHGPRFRVYTTDDVVGVELAGALKNIAAIACGISDGLGYGANARAGLMTRALAEMTRLGLACGARQATFFGLAGVGDLIATCQSDLSRNRRLGMALAGGASVTEAIASLGGVAEGVPTTTAARRLARERAVELPITEELYLVLNEGKSPTASLQALMGRSPASEI
jgi:glycerol-3-phosphate dehydrogenase (NAD(P)+)